MSGTSTSEAPAKRKPPRRAAMILIPLLGGGGLFLLVSFLNPWSRMSNVEYDVHLSTGRVRVTRHLLYIPVAQDLRDSPVSLALRDAGPLPPEDDGEWVRDNTFGWSVRNSPHHRFHGAQCDMDQLRMLWDFGKWEREARTLSARQLLHLWREHGDVHAADGYLQFLSLHVTEQAQREHRAVGVEDFPDPPEISNMNSYFERYPQERPSSQSR